MKYNKILIYIYIYIYIYVYIYYIYIIYILYTYIFASGLRFRSEYVEACLTLSWRRSLSYRNQPINQPNFSKISIDNEKIFRKASTKKFIFYNLSSFSFCKIGTSVMKELRPCEKPMTHFFAKIHNSLKTVSNSNSWKCYWLL